MEKSTEELMNELKSKNQIEVFIKKNESVFLEQPLARYLESLLLKYDIRKSEVIKRAALATGYGYQIFDGKREPKRDKLIQLAFGFGLTLEETQLLLRYGGHSQLYPKIKRDALFIYGINRNLEIEEIEHLLFQMEEKELEAI